MMLVDLHIAGFGRHRDFHLKVSSGLNLIVGHNESGKSTVMAFLRAMFYGFGRKHATIDKDLRRKYRPWDGAVYGGTIRFRHNEQLYRLTRRFGQDKSEDEVALFLDSTGERIPLKSSDRPGEVLFGISESEFINTWFAGQREITVNPTADLAARLFDDSGASYGADDVKRHLTTAKNDLVGRKGMLAEVDATHDDLVRLYEAAREADAQKAAMAGELLAIDERLQAIQAQQEEEESRRELAAALDLQMRANQVRALDQEAKEQDRSPHHIALTTAGEDITIHALADLSDRYQALVSQETEYEHLRARRREREDELRRLGDDYDALIEGTQAAEAERDQLLQTPVPPRIRFGKTQQNVYVAIAGLGAVCAVVAILVGQKSSLFRPLFLAGITGLVLGLFLLYRLYQEHERRIQQRKHALNQLNSERTGMERRLDELWQQQNHIATLHGTVKRTFDRLTHDVDAAASRIDDLSRALHEMLRPYCGYVAPEDYEAALARLRQQMMTPADMARAQKYRKLMNDVPDRVFWDAVAAGAQLLERAGIDPRDITLAQARLAQFEPLFSDEAWQALLEEEKELTLQRAKQQSAFAYIGRDLATAEEIRRDLRALEMKRAQILQLAAAIDKALLWLQDAMVEVDTLLAPQLNHLASRYLAAMTGDKYDAIRIDRQFQIRVASDDGLLREATQYSGATVDQIELSLRLALSTIISNETVHMPLFLDESLTQLDADRLARTIDVLQTETRTKQRQIFYLTTDDRLAQTVDASVNVLVMPSE